MEHSFICDCNQDELELCSIYKKILKQKYINTKNLYASQETFKIFNNKLSSLSNCIQQFISITNLSITNTKLKKITNLPCNLKILNLTNNDIHSIETLFPISLEYVNLSNNKLPKLDISNSFIREIKCDNNLIKLFRGCHKLKNLCLSNNPIIELKNIYSVELLNLNYCGLSNIDLSFCYKLYSLSIVGNFFDSLINLPKNLNLLNCSSNKIEKIILPKKLQYLYISSNKINDLVFQNSSLIEIYCCNNNITKIHIESPYFEKLICNENPLQYMELNSIKEICYMNNYIIFDYPKPFKTLFWKNIELNESFENAMKFYDFHDKITIKQLEDKVLNIVL
ncbi:Hypothetical protein KVN_LOCUS161 [uncultured virus]|nr:Hypothetical protein KVN_LOCUS161 [uncultured virus]